MTTRLRWILICLTISLGVGQGGCAIFGAVAGAALCGDSSDCRSGMVETGAAVDVAVAGAVINAVVEAEQERETEAARAQELALQSAGGEAPPSDATAYFHCVDGEGHHVIEVIAPSELDARFACIVQLGYRWSDPRADELCSCRSRS